MQFVDTNVLLYAISGAAQEAAKASAARAVLRQRDLGLSTQVLQEFYVQATRRSRPDAVPPATAVDFMHTLRRFPIAAITWDIVDAALASHRRWGISNWDAAILEAARTMGCTTVLSEDLNDQTDYAGLRVVNPFAGL